MHDALGHYGHRGPNRFKIGPKLWILRPNICTRHFPDRPFEKFYVPNVLENDFLHQLYLITLLPYRIYAIILAKKNLLTPIQAKI